jgi:serine/threonine protein kinase
LRWARQIALGVLDIHSLDLVHGDLKCHNVVIDARDNAKVIDVCSAGATHGYFWLPDEDCEPLKIHLVGLYSYLASRSYLVLVVYRPLLILSHLLLIGMEMSVDQLTELGKRRREAVGELEEGLILKLRKLSDAERQLEVMKGLSVLRGLNSTIPPLFRLPRSIVLDLQQLSIPSF